MSLTPHGEKAHWLLALLKQPASIELLYVPDNHFNELYPFTKLNYVFNVSLSFIKKNHKI